MNHDKKGTTAPDAERELVDLVRSALDAGEVPGRLCSAIHAAAAEEAAPVARIDEDLPLQAAVRDALDAGGDVPARVLDAIHDAAEQSARPAEDDERAIAPAVRDALDAGVPSPQTRKAIHDAAEREAFARRRGSRLRFLNFVSTAAAAVIVASFCITLHIESGSFRKSAAAHDFEQMNCLIDLVGLTDPVAEDAEAEAEVDFTYDDWLAELNGEVSADIDSVSAPPTPESIAHRLESLSQRAE